MSRDWDDDLDDMEHAASLFEEDPRADLVTVWLVDDETDAIIVGDILEDNSIVVSLVPASEAGKYAQLGHPDSIHVQVCRADADAALDIIQDSVDVPGTPVVSDDDSVFDTDDEQDMSESEESG